MNHRSIKAAAKAWCPPIMWKGLQGLRARSRRHRTESQKRVVTTLEELDREIAQAEQAAATSFDAFWDHLHQFRYEANITFPSDPASEAYRNAQHQLYLHLTGKTSYACASDEMTPFDYDAALVSPYPYCTHSTKTVGDQLIAIGYLIRTMNLKRGGSVLEFGPGWGKATLEFAQSGYAVTAVDINPQFLKLIAALCERNGHPVTTVRCDMLEYQSATPFDRVVFYESFHHCPDHRHMIAQLSSLVVAGGSAVFAGEPIDDHFPIPWGIRLDGMSAWAIRKFGWYELGFRTDYFLAVLAEYGWATTIHGSQDAEWQRVFVAKRCVG